MTSIAESISRFTNSVGDTINTTFKNISDFIDSAITFLVGVGFWIDVLVFFIVFFLLVSFPLLIFRYWDNISNQYRIITRRIVDSIAGKVQERIVRSISGKELRQSKRSNKKKKA